MDDFSHIFDAALSVLVGDTLFLDIDHLRKLLVSASSIDPMLPATADIFLHCSVTGSREAVGGRKHERSTLELGPHRLGQVERSGKSFQHMYRIFKIVV
jgi:hypothetical protein